MEGKLVQKTGRAKTSEIDVKVKTKGVRQGQVYGPLIRSRVMSAAVFITSGVQLHLTY